jgi:VIT1/CCC1 family predicted Fe2+/Mn2+ transporter
MVLHCPNALHYSETAARLNTTRLPALREPQSRTRKKRDVLQAAVLGVNDGLVSTLALLLGVAGAGSSVSAVRIAGLASLVAGAASIAVSQYIAGQTSLERRHRDAKELRPVDQLGEGEQASAFEGELIDRGIGRASAHVIGNALVADAAKASTVLGMIRYGFNAREGSSPLSSAWTTLVASAVGASIPILPWFFGGGRSAVIGSLALSGIAAAIIGGILGRESGGNVAGGAARQVVLVLIAAGVTYAIGSALQHAGAFAR